MSSEQKIPEWAMEAASATTSLVFEDLRDRRFLKWLFSEHPTTIGRLEGELLCSLDADVQAEIHKSWATILALALLAAEQRGLEKAAEVAAKGIKAPGEDAWAKGYRCASADIEATVCAAIRSLGEQQ